MTSAVQRECIAGLRLCECEHLYTARGGRALMQTALLRLYGVWMPETHFRLIQNKTDDDTVNVICAADGAFPAPNLTLATPERRLDGVSHNLKMINGRYSAVASVTLRDADLPSPAEFICTLRIPQAQYAVRKEAIYYPGPISTTPEMPTAADMQLAAAVGSRGATIYLALTTMLLPALAQNLVS
ncbi:uncharacterized protein LOC113235383 [Hyposmocoma kahamanoa]|uniref:uncharacterized protein LOC113235383 n=1 Tax=Hyposmocoma kahamanoa TaxID=1477025 RepID=UPI000E6D83D7|nr:uncharacterized protein LOC113235383 [Hyposmocoma kahamanoa]